MVLIYTVWIKEMVLSFQVFVCLLAYLILREGFSVCTGTRSAGQADLEPRDLPASPGMKGIYHYI